MKIFIGCDHNGFELKRHLKVFLEKSGYEVIDEGDSSYDPKDDFPLFAARVINGMKSSDEQDPKGVLICGSGQGMCMAANRYRGIRAALCWNVHEAHSSRNDDNSNVLCISAASTKAPEAEQILTAWLNTPFAGAPRFIRRLKELDELV
jgi:ribose 5-phosphate isomerase B